MTFVSSIPTTWPIILKKNLGDRFIRPVDGYALNPWTTHSFTWIDSANKLVKVILNRLVAQPFNSISYTQYHYQSSCDLRVNLHFRFSHSTHFVYCTSANLLNCWYAVSGEANRGKRCENSDHHAISTRRFKIECSRNLPYVNLAS